MKRLIIYVQIEMTDAFFDEAMSVYDNNNEKFIESIKSDVNTFIGEDLEPFTSTHVSIFDLTGKGTVNDTRG